jgi:hypothetical protein
MQKLAARLHKKRPLREDHMRVTKRLLAPAPEQTGSSPDHTYWQPLEKAPLGEPVLLVVPGRDAPVVAIQDKDGDWQVTWNGDVITDAIRWARIPNEFEKGS